MAGNDDQRATIAFLLHPESYGSAGPVMRIDTHAAMIFLAGDRAYKLKRAVRYSYLDFSTATKRKAVCDAELRLNSRTAPDLYLEVRSVNRLPDGSLGFGEGEPIDWLVVMRRFDADCLLEAVAERGALNSALVRDLADNIASFHDRAEAVRVSDGAARVRKVIDGNRESMAALESKALSREASAELHGQSVATLERVAALLDRRAASGHVRHCHGDLHLANICLWQGKPTLFDCLEFDVQLATTDVLHDLAFLLMDLWERGLCVQASLLFNRYLDMREEADGVAALPLFLSMRAAVRAHVSATAAGQAKDEAKRSKKLQAARDYLSAALSFLVRRPPRLIAIGGLSGTGKSTLAGGLAPWTGSAPGARWLRTDVLRKRLAGVEPEADLPAEAYTPERVARVYRRLMEDARTMLAIGQPVIVDGVFADPVERAQIAAVAKEAGTPFTGLWLEAPRQILFDRVTDRSGDASDADKSVVKRQLEYRLGDLMPWHRLDASGSPDNVLAMARTLIDT